MPDTLGPVAASSARAKSAAAFRTISEVASILDVPQHVLRFWETRFAQVKPLKRGGGRRYYRPEDVTLLQEIRRLLYSEGYTIKGVQRLMKDGSLKARLSEPAEPVQPAAVAASEGHSPTLPEPARAPIRAAIAELEAIRAALREEDSRG
ncbi:MAG TPA: MerR family transcriptional regulator [Alphaproteobacteria bacterium]|nr:MerR family transcriptional regulator [Alphaproteobacteria bacterium]